MKVVVVGVVTGKKLSFIQFGSLIILGAQPSVQLAIIQRIFAITQVIAPDYSSNGSHYDLKEVATRDPILGQKSDIIGINASKRN